MKGALIIFVLGMVAGAIALNYMKERRATEAATVESARPITTTQAPTSSFVDRARDAASDARDAVADKLNDWHLSGSDIKRDLAQSGEVVRTKAKSAGSSIAAATSNARVVAVIKAKYTLDRDLSARAIEVSSDAGNVTLHGTVASEELIGRAVALALDTDGVVQVKSLLTVQPPAGGS